MAMAESEDLSLFRNVENGNEVQHATESLSLGLRFEILNKWWVKIHLSELISYSNNVGTKHIFSTHCTTNCEQP